MSAGLLSDEMLAQARIHAMAVARPFVRALQEIAAWSPGEALSALSHRFDFPSMGLPELQQCEPLLDCVSFKEALARQLLVVRTPQQEVRLILTDPMDQDNETWATLQCRRQRLLPTSVLMHPDELQAFMSQFERQLNAMDGFESAASQDVDEEVAAVISLSTINEEASAVIKLVNSTLYDALKMQASDIHLECDAGCLHVMYRVDGVLVPVTQVMGTEMAEQVISRIKVMAELDIAERRVPQDGRFKVRISGRDVDFRVSVMPNIFGEDAVLRLLDRQSVTEDAARLTLEGLGLAGATIEAIRRLARKPHGMLLVTGPTGSGKTTTLYAAITEVHTGRDKIITIEDPVEYRLPRVLQIPVNEKKGLTFARGLRSILRHDPDKIMVGEIRDGETAQIAVQSALTGHLVFTSVHANSAFDVLGRFMHMGVDAYSFASALNGVVAQRLVRINCPQCRQQSMPDASSLEALGLSTSDVVGWQFMQGVGCPHCRGAGYKGRHAVAEVLVMDDVLCELIAIRAPVSQLKQEAFKRGMQPIKQLALALVARGDTTLEEVMRVAG
jgi:general secretion pathway protein E